MGIQEPFSIMKRSCLIKDAGTFLNKKIVLNGWITNVRSLNPERTFIVVRDYTAPIQLLLDSNSISTTLKERLPTSLESVIQVTGTVQNRPDMMIKTGDVNGNLEVLVDEIQLLNVATNVAFSPHQSHCLPDEDIRLQHRYLDLRRPSMQKNIRLRSKVNSLIRQYMESHEFSEIETPLLFRSTPEGAREFLVSAGRIIPGSHFALPQSPQQFKQMLMVAGFDRYYQIAKCFRDEPLRADRQPEFTQLDLEMSFVTEDDIINTIEDLLKHLWEMLQIGPIPKQFPRLTYNQVLRRYGTDKPDMRYAAILPIVPIYEDAQTITEKLIIEPLITSLLTEEILIGIFDRHGVSRSDEIVCSRDIHDHVGSTVLGKIRSSIIQELEHQDRARDFQQSEWSFLWVYDFPLLARPDLINYEDSHLPNRRFKSMHHPFTAPHPEDLGLLETDPLKVRGLHYDLVINGYEVGGGSIRIHSPDLQTRILQDVMGLPREQIQNFSHLLRALGAGCPPHGGIALGLDRMMTLICNAKSIRDVIAFPKNSRGFDLCSGAPN